MAKSNRDRINDTINWMVLLRTPEGTDNEARIQKVGELLEWQKGQIPDNIGAAMSIGNSGTEEERVFRRAIILTSCVFLNSDPAATQNATKSIMGALLRKRLRWLADLVFQTYPMNVLKPVSDALLDDPAAFLRDNLIVLGGSKASRPTDIALSFNLARETYDFTTTPNSSLMQMSVPGYFIGVDPYSSAHATIGNINAAQVTGNLVITTQLTGCNFLYRVNGPNLRAAHIQPGETALDHLPERLETIFVGPRIVNRKSLAMSAIFRERAVVSGNGGHMGMVGTVPNEGEDTYRQIDRGEGQEWMHSHGYFQPKGMVYIICVKSNGAWQIFLQQHTNQKTGMHLRRIYPPALG